MKAEIITIGDEILIGQIVDTNSAWMAVELNSIGVKIAQITSISDEPEHLVEALNNASKRANIVLITGGLGPTKDDRTKSVLVNYFNTKLVLNEPTLNHIVSYFKIRNLNIIELNKEQAMVPECCDVLSNPVGTAPGMWFEKDGIIYVSMPGVPFEMKQLMTDHVIPRLKKLSTHESIVHKTIQTIGIAESKLSNMLEEWEGNLPTHIHLAYLPSPGLIRLRLSAFGDDEALLQKEVDSQVEKLHTIIPEAIYGYGDDTIAEVTGRLLRERKQKLSVAESCTGGYISHLITSIPGSSKWFKGSVVAYSNESKINLLEVSESSLSTYGAVSESVVRQMAENVKIAMNTEYGIATSGIAGPDGGTDEKPVGMVWIAVSGPEKTVSAVYNFVNARDRTITRASLTALDMLRLMLINK